LSELQSKSGQAAIDDALIYYEIAGEGRPIVMIHVDLSASQLTIWRFAAMEAIGIPWPFAWMSKSSDS
jgi:hypothetical protein